MGRYIERAENVGRLVEVNLSLMLDLPVPEQDQWKPLVEIMGDLPMFLHKYEFPARESVLQWLTFDSENLNSIWNCVGRARENARSVREILSSEMWEQINELYWRVQNSLGMELSDSHRFYYDVRMAGHMIEGLAVGTMTHGEGWHFSRMGRLIERADKTSRILDSKCFTLFNRPLDQAAVLDDILWASVLRSCSAFEMYRKAYGRISPDNVLWFLIFDANFPRSIRNCVVRAQRNLHSISGTPVGEHENLAEKRIGRLRCELDYGSVNDVVTFGLHQYLDELQSKLNAIDDAIHQTFVAIRPMS